MTEAVPRHFAVLHHPKLPHSQPLAQQVAEFLSAEGADVWVGSSWDTQAVSTRLNDLDMIITLGGDGTILRTARLCAPAGKPLIGVNLGSFGFLAELQPDSWQEGLRKLLTGDYWLEERLMLDCRHYHGEQLQSAHLALNEAVVGRGQMARVVRIAAEVDNCRLSTYSADGLIAATPTGSTAYAFAAGGPIMPPTLRNILLVPIAPMFGLARPVVLSEGVQLRLSVHTDHEAMLTVDGQSQTPLAAEDIVSIRASEYLTRFPRLRPPSYFYDSLFERLLHH